MVGCASQYTVRLAIYMAELGGFLFSCAWAVGLETWNEIWDRNITIFGYTCMLKCYSKLWHPEIGINKKTYWNQIPLLTLLCFVFLIFIKRWNISKLLFYILVTASFCLKSSLMYATGSPSQCSLNQLLYRKAAWIDQDQGVFRINTRHTFATAC